MMYCHSHDCELDLLLNMESPSLIKLHFLKYNYQGGKSSRVVSCVLGLKAYSEWKQTGGTGVWKFGGNVKSTTSAKQFVRKNSEPFSSSLSRSVSMNEKSTNGVCTEAESNKMVGRIC